jgi:hypothetical protein
VVGMDNAFNPCQTVGLEFDDQNIFIFDNCKMKIADAFKN